MSSPQQFLRRILTLDALTSGLTGLALAVGAAPMESVLGLPAGLLRYAGVSLLPFAAFVLWVATREHVSRASVQVIIGLNAAWVAASAGLLLSGSVAPRPIGYAFVIGQAIVVGILTEAQYVGLRRSVIARPL